MQRGSGCVIIKGEVKGRRRRRCIAGGGGAAVQLWELFNWRVTLGARLVSSSPSITRGQEMPEVMLPAPHSLRIPRPAPAFNRHASITPPPPSPLIRMFWPPLTWPTVICSPVTRRLMGLFVHRLTRKTVKGHCSSLWNYNKIRPPRTLTFDKTHWISEAVLGVYLSSIVIVLTQLDTPLLTPSVIFRMCSFE